VVDRTVTVALVWPEKEDGEFRSRFDGAVPVAAGAWIDRSEIARFELLTRQKAEAFETHLKVDERGRVSSCHADVDKAASYLAERLCAQLVDHAQWLPAVDADGNPRQADVSLVAEYELRFTECHSAIFVDFNMQKGSWHWRVSSGAAACGAFRS